MHKRDRTAAGFTIVELLIVIVVISILAAVTVMAYNGVRSRAEVSKRESDLSTFTRAVTLARESQSRTLFQITNYGWSMGPCVATGAGNNPDQVEPRELPKTHSCWTRYYNVIDTVSAASGANLSGLKSGDARGNPYIIDENEGEGGTSCNRDAIWYFTGNAAERSVHSTIPLSGFTGC